MLASLSRCDAPWVPRVVLASYAGLEPELRPKAVELLSERAAWAGELLDAIGRGEIPTAALNVNQVRQLMSSGNAELVEKVKARWGTIRTDRDPKRDEVVRQMRSMLRHTAGDARTGQEIFNRVCGQCHKLHGQGQDVGPDITLNGRSSFEQLLSNVFDPSLVIGAAYQARTILTEDGRVLTGLVAEESDCARGAEGARRQTRNDRPHRRGRNENQPVVADARGFGKTAQITGARRSVRAAHIGQAAQRSERQAIAGLGADRAAANLRDPAQFGSLISDVAPGFAISQVGKPGLAIVAEHAGREGVSAHLARQPRAAVRIARVFRSPAQQGARGCCSPLQTTRAVRGS